MNDKKYISEEDIEEKLRNNICIEPFPFYTIDKTIKTDSKGNEYISAVVCEINIEDLMTGTYYGTPKFDKNNSPIVMFKFIVICDDGTIKKVLQAAHERLQIYFSRMYDTDSKKIYTIIKDNTKYEINLTDKSTSDTVTVASVQPYKYLEPGNNVEYIPTTDYSPSTKKYVDDNIKNKVTLPLTEDGTIDSGIVGQFAVSDGNGGITWVTIPNAEEASF